MRNYDHKWKILSKLVEDSKEYPDLSELLQDARLLLRSDDEYCTPTISEALFNLIVFNVRNSLDDRLHDNESIEDHL